MRKLKQEILDKMKDAFLRYPTLTDNQIAKKIKINNVTLGKYRKIYDKQIDQEFIAITAGKFISEFGKASDYWKMQIDELEELKKSTKTIFKKGKNGKSYAEKVDLEPSDILAIVKHQTDLRKNILYLAAQGEVREVIKIMRSGKLPMLETNQGG